jgi:hypothetical protein
MFIPWGTAAWVDSKMAKRTWAYLGCLSREDRSLTAMKSGLLDPSYVRYVRVFDEDPDNFQEELRALDERVDELLAMGVGRDQITDAPLLAPIDELVDILEGVRSSSDSLIIDISSFPKRWFFSLLRLALVDFDFSNVMAYYAGAAEYAPVLSFNPEVIKTLPGFTSMRRRGSCDVALVSVGYHSHSVLDLFDVERPRSLRILFPFPPGPQGIARNWRFVERLERAIKVDGDQGEVRLPSEIRVGALDLPQNFLALRKATDDGTKTSLVAPFGPKPVSMAMCLFALAAEVAGRPEVPAYYSQPMRYAADYTRGVELSPEGPNLVAYPIKVEGRNLYVM